MSEVTEEKKELVLVTLPAEKQDLEVALLSEKFIEEILDGVRKSAGSVVGDLKTAKGRGVYITMADKVRKSKAAFEVRAKDLVAELKARPALIDANRKRFRDEMDKIAVAIRKPVTDWEAEQERLKAEEAMNAMHADALVMNEEFDRHRAAQIEADHEMALLMNDKFDRDREEQRHQAEQAQRERDERLQREAAERATREAEEKANRERQQHQDALSEISGIQQQVIIAQSGRLGVRQGGTIQCIKDTLAETEAWPIDERFGSLMDAAENAKQQAIAQIKQLLINAETIQKQQEENDRILREAEEKEKTRLAEEKCIADETARREADVKHRKAVGTEIVNALLAHTSITRDQAKEVLTALKDGLVPRAKINY
ncbi:hypothetical protein [Kosakonia radicincitans]|uniref:hypothetical protein n=1 Tax=Kosakonia radicincitans TaxID=283686 RepID=UPI001D0922CE|nr:hypothetical protein [Kosakonia radicincitans]